MFYKMNVLCLFVNYNNSNYSIDCANSLVKNKSSINLTIAVIDNNSFNEEKIKLLKWQTKTSSINVMYLEKNIGYFPALNYGLTLYKDCIDKYDYVVIGNNDLIFQEDFLSVLSSRKYSDDIFVIAPNIINADNHHQNPQMLKRYSNLRLMYLDMYFSSFYVACLLNYVSKFIAYKNSQRNQQGYDVSQYISIGYGACYILTRKYIQIVKVIPDYLFLMNEENALADLVLRNNGRTFYDRELIVNHMEHTSVGCVPKRNLYDIAKKSYKISKLHFNNRYLFDRDI